MWMIAVFYALAGYVHLTTPRPFLMITPGWVPWPGTIVCLTGIAELLGAVALVQPFDTRLRKAGGWGLALYAICVFPANINHFAMDMAKPDHGFGLGYHVPRMFAQPLLVWLALWASSAIEWPWRTPAPSAY
jgi:uncharacterized membrane protein